MHSCVSVYARGRVLLKARGRMLKGKRDAAVETGLSYRADGEVGTMRTTETEKNPGDDVWCRCETEQHACGAVPAGWRGRRGRVAPSRLLLLCVYASIFA
eukprot:2738339-Pleurochrysis_carterae.AAC.1